ncbi:radical SAM family heme chaperone HemW [Gammaproteobacteria bacterium]|nr:radical SAM family heme chaperone HemW [Gammaproteobacteria bacterium]
MTPLSLYIHLPWCVKKCPYCDFNAHPLKTDTPKDLYIEHLMKDLQSHESVLRDRPLHSIFIGGGTPSIFSASALKPLFDALKPYLNTEIEITMEANPGVLDCAQFPDYRDLGINRLSIGGQSFDQGSLTALGRFHSATQTHQAIRIAKHSGFERINLDLMYGTPHQSLAQALYDLELFLSYDLEHLSWYQLNIEPNTLFAVKKPHLPKNHLIDSMDHHGRIMLKQAGYHAYEISAWTKSRPSFHNLNYWQFGDYIGIGAGAHSKITANHTITRIIKHKHPKAYMREDKIQEITTVTQQQVLLEFAINFFRTTTKMNFTDLKQRTMLSKADFLHHMAEMIQLGWVVVGEHDFQTTKLGQRFYNELCLRLSQA